MDQQWRSARQAEMSARPPTRAPSRAGQGGATIAAVRSRRATGVETALLEGRPAEVLARIADQRGASEIVVGSPKPARGRTLLGSRVVRKLVATAGRPVVVVPAPSAR